MKSKTLRQFVSALLFLQLFYAPLTYAADINIYEDTLIQTNTGYDYNTLNVHSIPPDTTTLTMTGGQGYGIRVKTYESSIFDMHYGSVYAITTYDTSKVRIENTYSAINSFNCYDFSEAEIRGGAYAYSLYFRENSFGAIYGGFLPGVTLYNSSRVDFYNGSADVLSSSNSARINLYGGTIKNTIYTADDSVLNIYNCDYTGTLAIRLIASQNGIINIHGRNFSYDPDGGRYGYGHLSGYFQGNKSFDFDLWENTYSHINLIQIPEPAAIGLLLLGAALARKQRK